MYIYVDEIENTSGADETSGTSLAKSYINTDLVLIFLSIYIYILVCFIVRYVGRFLRIKRDIKRDNNGSTTNFKINVFTKFYSMFNPGDKIH